jgi:pentatricopeptide repeat protein
VSAAASGGRWVARPGPTTPSRALARPLTRTAPGGAAEFHAGRLPTQQTRQKKRLRDAEATFEWTNAAGVTPTVVTYNSLISACGTGGQWQKAETAFERMQAAGLTPKRPNVITYTSLSSACGTGEQWQKAGAVFREMLMAGVSPTVYSRSLFCVQGRSVGANDTSSTVAHPRTPACHACFRKRGPRSGQRRPSHCAGLAAVRLRDSEPSIASELSPPRGSGRRLGGEPSHHSARV